MLRLVVTVAWRTRRRYAGYVTAIVLAVATTTAFAVLAANPALRDPAAAQALRPLVAAGLAVIAMFAVFFVLFFHAFLLRTRGPELGLYLALGAPPRRLARLVAVESLLLSAVAGVPGFVLGCLAVPGLVAAAAAVLDLDRLPTVFPAVALGGAGAFFAGLFLVDALVSARRVRRTQVRSLLGADRTTQARRRGTVPLALLGLVCLAGAYLLVAGAGDALPTRIVPALVLLAVATYLLFSRALVVWTTWRRCRPGSATALVTAARTGHRLGDAAKVATAAALLSALAVTTLAVGWSFVAQVRLNAHRSAPFALTVEAADPAAARAGADAVAARLADEDLTATRTDYHLWAGTLVGPGTDAETFDTAVTDATTYAALREALVASRPDLADDAPALDLAPGAAAWLIPYPHTRGRVYDDGARLSVGEVTADLRIDQRPGRVRDEGDDDVPFDLLVVSDADAARLLDAPPDWTGAAFGLDADALDADQVAELRDAVGDAAVVSATAPLVREGLQMVAAALFVCVVLAVLLFVAASATLTVKTLTQVPTDRRQMVALRRVGFTADESRRVLRAELRALFAAPVVAALVHAAVLVVGFLSVTPSSVGVWAAYACAAVGYAAVFALFYVLTARGYVRRTLCT